VSSKGGSSGKVRRGGGFGMDSGTCGCHGKSSLTVDMCHHRGHAQILITTDAPLSLLLAPTEGKAGKRSTRGGCFRTYYEICVVNLFRL